MDKSTDFSTNPMQYLPIEGTSEKREWIPAAKTGEVVGLADSTGVITAEALASSVGTWKGQKIFQNHQTEREGELILGDKYEDPYLYFLLQEKTINALKAGSGGSIDAKALQVENNRILKMSGAGYSILDKNLVPACNSDMGCGVKIAGEAKEVGNEVHESKTKKDGEKNMADAIDKKTEVVFSKEQVAEIKASAVAEITTQMENEHKVAVGEMETAQKTALDELKTAHATELETERAKAVKDAAMVESLATKYALSDEAKKGLTEAKTLEDALTLFSTLKVEKADPVVAAKSGKGTEGGGIVMGAVVEGKAPEVRKIEEVGTYDPYTRKYVPSFREEVME